MTIPRSCKENNEETPAPDCRALYVHVPFCAARCRYCDFYSTHFDPAVARRYVEALAAELRTRRGALRLPLASAFVGGGTPTALGAELLGELLSLLTPLTDGAAEFSVEANPATLTDAVVAVLAAAGVNRVNVGVQSFCAEELRLLGRIHSAAEAKRAVGALGAAGFENLSLDLIYGVPGQTLATWRASLGEALALRPEHLSCYALSYEPGTPLARDLAEGRVAAMDESLQAECYDQAIAAAARAGLAHYEISNFARAGRRCRHNLTYWRNEPYLGIGPAAASYVAGVRRTNAPDLDAYVLALARGQGPPFEQERLTGRRAMAEAVMLGLRLTEGIDRQAFLARYGLDVVAAFPRSIARYAELGALEVSESRVRIAPARLFVADTILADIVAEA